MEEFLFRDRRDTRRIRVSVNGWELHSLRVLLLRASLTLIGFPLSRSRRAITFLTDIFVISFFPPIFWFLILFLVFLLQYIIVCQKFVLFIIPTCIFGTMEAIRSIISIDIIEQYSF